MLLNSYGYRKGRAGPQRAISQIEKACFSPPPLFFESHNLEAVSQETFGNTTSSNAQKTGMLCSSEPRKWLVPYGLFSLSSQARHRQSSPQGQDTPAQGTSQHSSCSPSSHTHQPGPLYHHNPTAHSKEREGKRSGRAVLFSSHNHHQPHPTKHIFNS